MTTYLFFDTSANGSPIKWSLPHTDTFNWPRMIQLSWLVINENKKVLEEGNYIIKPSGFEISEEVAQKHKLSQEDAAEQGVPLKEALQAFRESFDKADMVVTHNLQFNENVLRAEYLRSGLDIPFDLVEKICLMREGTHFAGIPGKGGKLKWPTLQELYNILFGKRFKYANNAYIDVKVTAACFFALKEKGELDDLF